MFRSFIRRVWKAAYWRIVGFFEKRSMRERKKSYGELNPDKSFYLIRRKGQAGLYSVVHTMLGRIAESEERGCIPVIDMQHYPMGQLEETYLGKKNAWEIYFLQPSSYTLEEVYHSKNVILSDLGADHIFPRIDDGIFEDEERIGYWNGLYERYIHYNPKTENYLNRIIPQGMPLRMLGLLCRGTDYTRERTGGHPQQPDCIEIWKKAVEFVDRYNLEGIFLATEDQEYFEYILGQSRKAGIAVFYIDQTRYIDVPDETQDELELRNMQYLASIECLARCTCLIGGRNNGTLAATLKNGNRYEGTFFWDLGMY